MASAHAVLSKPIIVADLALPPDMAAEIEAHCRACRFSKRDRITVMEDAKVRHHYAGHSLVATEDRYGMRIHAIDLNNPDEVHELKKRLESNGNCRVVSLFPIPLSHEESFIS